MKNNEARPFGRERTRLTRRGVAAVAIAAALGGGVTAKAGGDWLAERRSENHLYRQLTQPDARDRLSRGEIDRRKVVIVTAKRPETADQLALELVGPERERRPVMDAIYAQAGPDGDVQPGAQFVIPRSEIPDENLPPKQP